MNVLVRVLTVAVACLAAASASASFLASDLVYVPVAAHNEGTEGSLWRTDIYINNVDETPIDVCLFFFPSGLFDNSNYLAREFGLGGRETEGFGFLDETLADIPVGGTVVLQDVVGEHWQTSLGTLANLGAIVVFAYEAGTLDAATGRVFRNAIVTSRTYNETTIWVPDTANVGQYIEQDATYGQSIDGVPWYNMADAGAVSDIGDFSFQVLVGGADTDILRYNVGMFNASDQQTSVVLTLQPFQADGSPFLNDAEEERKLTVSLPPLAHVQYNRLLQSVWALEDVAVATVKVSFASWFTNNPEPIPLFTSYGSVIDGRTNDPTTISPSFATPYNVDCMWPSEEPPPKARSGRRPLDIPSR